MVPGPREEGGILPHGGRDRSVAGLVASGADARICEVLNTVWGLAR